MTEGDMTRIYGICNKLQEINLIVQLLPFLAPNYSVLSTANPPPPSIFLWLLETTHLITIPSFYCNYIASDKVLKVQAFRNECDAMTLPQIPFYPSTQGITS